jgi:hypothetical protein
MSRAYHCVVHQFQTLQRCPIHKSPLELECRFCGYEASERFAKFDSTFDAHQEYGAQALERILEKRAPQSVLQGVSPILVEH